MDKEPGVSCAECAGACPHKTTPVQCVMFIIYVFAISYLLHCTVDAMPRLKLCSCAAAQHPVQPQQLLLCCTSSTTASQDAPGLKDHEGHHCRRQRHNIERKYGQLLLGACRIRPSSCCCLAHQAVPCLSLPLSGRAASGAARSHTQCATKDRVKSLRMR